MDIIQSISRITAVKCMVSGFFRLFADLKRFFIQCEHAKNIFPVFLVDRLFFFYLTCSTKTFKNKNDYVIYYKYDTVADNVESETRNPNLDNIWF